MVSFSTRLLALAIVVALATATASAQNVEPMGLTDFELCPAFDDVTINVVGDAGHNLGPYEFWADDFAEMGINVQVSGVPFDSVYEVLKTEFVARTGAFDVVTFYPSYIGDFAGNGYLMPLDDFMTREPASVWDPRQDDVLPPFRLLYNQWGGQTYALTVDGDVLAFMYRQDLFEHEGEREAFAEEYGRELVPPRTWDEFLEVGAFFTRAAGETLGDETLTQPFYGSATFGARGFSYAWFMNRAASAGVLPFDEDMNPTINTDAAVAALQNMVDSLDNAPPDVLSFGYDELRDAFISGRVAMVVQWTDVPKKAADPAESDVVGKVGVGRVPGTLVDGEIQHRSAMPVGRVVAVAADTEHPEAAYCVAKHIAYNRSLENVSTALTGLDPYRQSHLDHPEAFAELMGEENATVYLDGLQAALGDGFPEIFIPGAAQYQDALDLHVNQALAGQETPQQALDAVATEWARITNALGRDQQVEFWRTALDSYRSVGLID